jgi:hypothetical protein
MVPANMRKSGRGPSVHPKGVVKEAVIAALINHRGQEMALADIYKAVRASIGPTSESGIRMTLQNARPRTENTRRGFWRLAL